MYGSGPMAPKDYRLNHLYQSHIINKFHPFCLFFSVQSGTCTLRKFSIMSFDIDEIKFFKMLDCFRFLFV